MTPTDLVNGVPVPLGRPLPELVQMLDDNGPKRWAAFEAVARTPGRDAFEALLARIKCADPLVRRAAIEALGGHELGPEAADGVRAALHDTSPYVVRTACEVLGSWRDGEAHPGIARLLGSSEPATRQSALRALSGIWQPSDFEQVLGIMLHDPDEEVRKQAGWTIRANVGNQVWEKLFTLWASDPLVRNRKWACEIAAEFGDPGHLHALDQLSHDTDGHVRASATRAIRAVQDRRT
jgi:HEAT repeat protein